jgi:hypothetical protein
MKFFLKDDHGSSRSVLLVIVKKTNYRKSTYPLGSQEIKDDVKAKNYSI